MYGMTADAFVADIFEGVSVKREWMPGLDTSGTEVWGEELNCGDVFVFNSCEVDAKHQRKSIGKNLVDAVLKVVKDSGIRYIFAAPEGFRMGSDPMCEMVDKKVGGPDMEKALAFWRAVGFRRVGRSEWLGFAVDPEHPSHGLPAEDDPDLLPEYEIESDE
jgi:GNAT superfamily N-acetyltransferase